MRGEGCTYTHANSATSTPPTPSPPSTPPPPALNQRHLHPQQTNVLNPKNRTNATRRSSLFRAVARDKKAADKVINQAHDDT